MLDEIDKSTITDDVEEVLLETLYKQYGTIALVFYKRAKEEKLIEDKHFSDLDIN